jgi:hypothetical protein
MLTSFLLIATLSATPGQGLCSVGAVRDDSTEVEDAEPVTMEEIVTPPEALVRGTPVIVRAQAVRFIPAERGQWPGGVVFRITEVLKGTGVPDTLTLAGFEDPRDDFNSDSIPYRFARGGTMGGTCYAYNYKSGAEYLLFLGTLPWGLSPYHSVFSPTNEQLRGTDDRWLVWVRAQITLLGDPPPPNPAAAADATRG